MPDDKDLIIARLKLVYERIINKYTALEPHQVEVKKYFEACALAIRKSRKIIQDAFVIDVAIHEIVEQLQKHNQDLIESKNIIDAKGSILGHSLSLSMIHSYDKIL